MKKILRTTRKGLFAAFFLGSAVMLYAQNYLINEGFDNFPSNLNGTAYNSWTAVTISGDTGVDRWQFNNSIGYDIASPLDGQVALADAYMGGYTNTGSNNTNAQDIALVSPTVSTVGLSNLTLTYDELYLQLNSSTVFVEVSTNGGTSWTSVYTTAAGGFFPQSRTISLNSYTGNASFKIRFRWTKPASTTHGYWMLDNVKLFSRYANDVGVETLVDPKNNACPNAAQGVSLKVTNFGTSSASNISVNMGVSGGSSGNFSTTITSLGAGNSVNVFTGNTINTTSGGNINFSAYTTYAGDQTTTNDTLNTTIVTAPTPTDPSGNAIVQCGVGPVTLSANAVSGETTVWYEDGSTNVSLGSGNPFVYSNTVYASRDFYAENTRNLPSTHSTGLTGVYRYNTANQKGIFFDITASNEIVIDSFASNFAYSGRYICSVYYRAGGYLGYVTNQAAFTLLKIDTVDAAVLGQPAYISLEGTNFRIGSGQSYGFAIAARVAPGSSSIYPSYAFKLGVTNNVANEDMVVYAADVSETIWTNSLNGYSGDVNVYYQKVCKSQRKPISVVIVPRPSGVELISGNPNNGLYQSGTPGNPDVARLNDTFTYELTPPTGYTNADFGTGWMVTDISFKTASGMGPNTSDTMTTSPGASNGSLRYIPTSGVDSVLILSTTILDLNKMCDTTVTRYLLIGADPNAQFNTQAICEGDQTSFNNISSIASGSLTFKWYFGDGDSSDQPNPMHTYATAGSYAVRLIATSNFGFVDIFDSTIQVYEIPDADFTTNNVCEGASHQFVDGSYIPSIGSPVYTWDFGDGSATSNQSSPSHQYSSAGTYVVSLHVDVNGCSDDRIRYVTLAPRAVPSFGGPTACNSKGVEFTNGTTLAFGSFGSTWKFGDGNTSTAFEPKHVYSAFGNVDVTLVITTDLGCMDSVTNTIALIESPKASFTLSSACSEEAIQINNTTTVPTTGTNGYQWMLGNGISSTLDNPVTSYPAPGIYTMKLLVQNTNGCADSLTEIITIDTKPIASFVAMDVCDGNPVVFKNNTVNTPGAVSYAWDFGNGMNSAAYDTSFVYGSTGTYSVILYAATANGCMDTAGMTINVNEMPSAAFTVSTAQIGDGTMAFQGPAGSGYNYQWFLGDGNKSTQKDFTHTYQIQGNYQVRLIVTTNAGCESMSDQLISVTPTGINEVKEALNYYPNPSDGSLNLDLTELAIGEYTVRFRDIQGKEIRVLTLQGGAIHALNLHDFAAGTYVIEVHGDDLHLSGRITLTR